MLAASPMRAAENTVSASVPASVPSGNAAAASWVVRADPRTGKLVRRPALASSTRTASLTAPKLNPVPAPNPKIAAMVEESARAHSVDPLLVHSVISVESNYNPYAVSPKGAEGLMQLMPPTARQLGVSNSFDPQQNIEAGVKYLKYLQDLYHDDRLALAAYNAGSRNVDKYNRTVPPYPETQNYVDRVGKRYNEAKKTAEASAAPVAPPASDPAAAATVPAEPKPAKLEEFVDQYGRLNLRTAQ